MIAALAAALAAAVAACFIPALLNRPRCRALFDAGPMTCRCRRHAGHWGRHSGTTLGFYNAKWH